MFEANAEFEVNIAERLGCWDFIKFNDETSKNDFPHLRSKAALTIVAFFHGQRLKSEYNSIPFDGILNVLHMKCDVLSSDAELAPYLNDRIVSKRVGGNLDQNSGIVFYEYIRMIGVVVLIYELYAFGFSIFYPLVKFAN